MNKKQLAEALAAQSGLREDYISSKIYEVEGYNGTKVPELRGELMGALFHAYRDKHNKPWGDYYFEYEKWQDQNRVRCLLDTYEKEVTGIRLLKTLSSPWIDMSWAQYDEKGEMNGFWRMYPVNMLCWRALSFLIRFHFPQILLGAYGEGEASMGKPKGKDKYPSYEPPKPQPQPKLRKDNGGR